jgi:hypothetical protein
MRVNLHLRTNLFTIFHTYSGAESKAKHVADMVELHNNSDTKSLSKDGIHKDRSAQRHSEDSSAVHATTDHREWKTGQISLVEISRTCVSFSSECCDGTAAARRQESRSVDGNAGDETDAKREKWACRRSRAVGVGKLGMWSAEDANGRCASAYLSGQSYCSASQALDHCIALRTCLETLDISRLIPTAV